MKEKFATRKYFCSPCNFCIVQNLCDRCPGNTDQKSVLTSIQSCLITFHRISFIIHKTVLSLFQFQSLLTGWVHDTEMPSHCDCHNLFSVCQVDESNHRLTPEPNNCELADSFTFRSLLSIPNRGTDCHNKFFVFTLSSLAFSNFLSNFLRSKLPWL